MRGYDYEVVGDKIAEMVGDFYERELEIRDADIKRLRQQVEEALNALKEIADKESWHCCSVSRSMKGIAIAALEKIEGSK